MEMTTRQLSAVEIDVHQHPSFLGVEALDSETDDMIQVIYAFFQLLAQWQKQSESPKAAVCKELGGPGLFQYNTEEIFTLLANTAGH